MTKIISTTHKTTMDTAPLPGTTKYYWNCRGVNYVPSMEKEWEKSGYIPRITNSVALNLVSTFLPNVDASNVFQGANKTSQWRYYDHDDNENNIKLLRSLGINALRVFTDIYVWEWDQEHFINSIRDFLGICDKNKVRVQFVLWDGIDINNTGSWGSTPTTSGEAVSSMVHGLFSTWRSIPHEFQRDPLDGAEGQYFFENSATPFITQIVSACSAYQSFWSFDIGNEFVGSSTSSLVEQTSILLSSLNSFGFGITYGHSAGMNPYTSLSSYPNHYDMYNYRPDLFNFATIHPYQNNAIARRGFVNGAVSAAQILGLPVHSNENGIPGIGQNYDYDISGFYALRFGTMAFDGMIDRALSIEPFLCLQGLMFPDGTVRRKSDADAYALVAKDYGWLKGVQLNTNNTQKYTSVNNGADGGYWSGTINSIDDMLPEHRTYDSNRYTSITESQWTAIRDTWIYQISAVNKYSILPTLKYAGENASKNYAAPAGHPMSTQAPNYSLVVSGFNIQDMLDVLYDWSSFFPPLSSIDYAVSGDDFRAKDIQLWRRDSIIDSLMTSIGDQLTITRDIFQTEYDNSIVPSAIQQALIDAYTPLNLDNTSSITAWAGPALYLSSTIRCNTNSPKTCLFIDDDETMGIDWDAYDAVYNTFVDAAKDFWDILIEEALTNDEFALTP